jgi:hypothetical protein
MYIIKIQQERQCTYNATLRHIRVPNVSAESSITHSECVSVALRIQHAKHTRRIILATVACLASPYFPTLSAIIFGHSVQNFFY